MEFSQVVYTVLLKTSKLVSFKFIFSLNLDLHSRICFSFHVMTEKMLGDVFSLPLKQLGFLKIIKSISHRKLTQEPKMFLLLDLYNQASILIVFPFLYTDPIYRVVALLQMLTIYGRDDTPCAMHFVRHKAKTSIFVFMSIPQIKYM